jgi:Alpha/beta hydrolase family
MRVLLVHGMGRTPLSLASLARFLRRQGYHVERVGYVAAVESFDGLCGRIRRHLERMAQTGAPYAMVGHSLGGLALRAALSGVEPPPRHLVMLATPNQPPRLARRLHRLWAYRLVCGESGQLLARPEFFQRLPPLAVPYTIIAGSAGRTGRGSPFGGEANDWVVGVNETKLVSSDQPIVLPVGHTFMMNNRQVQAVIHQALQRVAA